MKSREPFWSFQRPERLTALSGPAECGGGPGEGHHLGAYVRDCTSITGTVDEELADILIYVCAIANRRNIDLDEALRKNAPRL